ncbi:uncharacterized protein [Coffea arabica]|uniref:Uncharacterized protein isoform X1 n=1 Tax=Coffea arabica TaxID=13443 RepID=A0ABM4WVH6_COFAR
MPNSARPPPPLTPTHSPSQKRLLAAQKPKHTPLPNSAQVHLPQNDKKTRDLPNLSDCHGCGLRIDYSNPKLRLQPLDSFWRIVLLCKKCIKQVTSGQICLYCFKDIANPSSDCLVCRDCDRLIHKDCVSKFGNSTPWSFCTRDLGFSVCIDCWVPELLKNSVRVRKKKNENGDSGSSGRAQNADRSLEETVKDAHCSVEKKVALAVKAKEKALRKAVVAKNAVELASNALDLAVKKDGIGKTISEGLMGNASHEGSGVSDVTRVVDDAELAFRLHRAMNSSPRISKNTCSVNLSCSDVLKKNGSNGISPNWMDSGSHEGGKAGGCTNSKLDEVQERSISETSAYVESKEGGSVLASGSLKPVLKTYSRNNLKRNECFRNGEVGDTMSVGVIKPVLKTYRRNNLKRRECLENGEIGDAVTSAVVKPVLRTYTRNVLKRKECLGNGEVGDLGTCTIKDDTRIVSESQCCLQDEVKMELPVDSAWNFSPEQSSGDIIQQEGSANAKPEECLLEYNKRIRGSSQGLQTDASSYCIAFNKENQASAPRLAYCSAECSGLSDASLHSCVVNLQGCASVVGSSQEGI